MLSNKSVRQLQKIFKNLPKPLEWRSFYIHDLNLLVDTPPEVKAVSVKQRLGKSQTRALGKLNSVSKDQFEESVRES